MCGIVGLLSAEGQAAVETLYEALLALQHRGQDAAGIITEDAGRFCLCKDNGMVRDVFNSAQMSNLRGSIGIGHVRYPTAGSSSCAEAQPFYVNSPYGITLAHNGNLVGLPALQEELEREFRHINTGSDSEVLLNLLAIELFSNLNSPTALKRARSDGEDGEDGAAPAPAAAAAKSLPPGVGPTDEQVVAAVRAVLGRCTGGYACVSMIIGFGLLAFRDPNGIRPLAYGRRLVEPSPGAAAGATKREFEYMVASESGALNALGFELLGDVPPGHVLLLRRGKEPLLENCLPAAPLVRTRYTDLQLYLSIYLFIYLDTHIYMYSSSRTAFPQRRWCARAIPTYSYIYRSIYLDIWTCIYGCIAPRELPPLQRRWCARAPYLPTG